MTIRQLLAVLALVAAFAGVGCNGGGANPDPDVAAQTESERASLNTLFGAVSEQTHKLSFHTPEDQLQEAKRKSEELRDRLEKLPGRTEIETLRLEAAKQQVSRLDAAMALKQTRDRWDKLLKDAELEPKEQALPLEQKRAILREQWPDFRIVDQQLIANERRYTDAGNNLAAALRRVRDAEELAEG
jgi:predicted nuclease with TOPRIM domain